jgi:hypothetical protein
MPMYRYSDQQVPLKTKIHNSLRYPNPPILENIHYLPNKPLSHEEIDVRLELCLTLYV